MGDRDSRQGKPTRRFDSAQLAALSRTADETPASVASGTEPPPRINRPRTPTLEDPLTTQLLCEVSRRAQTVDFDQNVVDEAIDALGLGETDHPNTRRRLRSR